MRKKDYELIARVFYHADDGNGYKHYILLALATAFKNENPRFDRNRFLKSCGIEICNHGSTEEVTHLQETRTRCIDCKKVIA